MDQPKIERMLRLMKYMSGNVNYTIDELAEKLDMSYRTIYRYIDTFKAAGFVVTKLYGNIYKLGEMPRNAVDIDHLIYFSEEEAYLVNSLIDRLVPSNSLRANLKDKLSAVYNCTTVADYVDNKFTAAHVETLGDAAKAKKKVILKNYESGNSHTIRDRNVEPFAFTRDYMDVWAYDLEDGHNKTFKVSRIGEVEVTEEDWTAESCHAKNGMDVFRMTGIKPIRVKLRMSLMAKNLLVEEFPLAEKDLKQDGEYWILDTEIYNFAGICRFCVGLLQEITIVDSPDFRNYVRKYLDTYRETI